MKLSLITATHNRPQILAEKALPSVLGQQVEATDFEWIVVNDGGDCTMPEAYPAIQPHIKRLKQLAEQWQAKADCRIATFRTA